MFDSTWLFLGRAGRQVGIACWSLTAFFALSVSALAQDSDDADEEEIEEVVVYGTYAGSLQAAMEQKKSSELVIEAISITDLGQLPDTNIADALRRLPGITATRDPNNGAASNIQLRGMPSELTLGTLNGRDLATQSPTRNVRYDQFPSELIGGVTVYKSSAAIVNDGGVAGAIDLKTVRPLDTKHNKLSFDVRYMQNDLAKDLSRSDDSGYRGSIAYIGKNADETLGFAVGWAHRNEPVAVIRTQHQSYRPDNNYRDTDGDGVGDLTTYGLTHFVRAGDDKRDGAFAALEWEPNDSFSLFVDALYSQVDVYNAINGFNVKNVSELWANTYTDATTIDNQLVSGTVTANNNNGGVNYGVRLENAAGFSDRDDNLVSLGVNAAWQVSDVSRVTFDIAHSEADYLARYASIGTQPLDLRFANPFVLTQQGVTFDATTELPTMSFNVDLADANINRPYQLQANFYRDGTDEIDSARVDYERDISLGLFDRFLVGVRFVDRDKTNLKLSQSGFIAVADRQALSADMILADARGSYGGAQTITPGFITFDFFDAANAYFGGYNPTSTVADQIASWEVNEKTSAAYLQFGFEGGNNVPFSGNIGVRFVDTQSTSSSVRRTGGAGLPTVLEPYSVDNDYQEVLPSATINFQPTEEWIIRLGLGKTIARAPVEDLNAGFDAWNGAAGARAWGGNPTLEPFRADQVDLSAEYYYGSNSYVAVASYYKDLETFITTSTEIVDIDGVDTEFFRPVNGTGGYIKGVEVTFSHQFESLPAPFSGLGVYANVALADSNVEVSRNYAVPTLGLVGMSDYVYTLSAYYNLGKFDANFSYSERDDFARIVDGGAFEVNEGEGFLRFQASYRFTDNLTAVVQGLNLTDAEYLTNLGDPRLRGRYEEFGRTYYVGFKAAF